MAVVDPYESSPGTAWSQRDTALGRFLRTETASAAFLLGAALSALVWANVDASSYDRVWQTHLSIYLGHAAVSLDLRDWVNSGLMSFFFLVVGLEARREFDIGEFRDRPRIILPVLAGLGGMAGAVGLFLAINAGQEHGTRLGVCYVDRYRLRPRTALLRQARSRTIARLHTHTHRRRRHRGSRGDRNGLYPSPDSWSAHHCDPP